MIDGVIDGGRVRVGACCGPIRSGVVALDRAEGWRYLSRLTRAALELMLEHSNPHFPVFYRASHTTVKIGADNPDNTYLNATVAPDRTYRLRGRRGTVPYLDTAGHRSGITMLLRWTCAKSHPVPRCTVTNLAALERR